MCKESKVVVRFFPPSLLFSLSLLMLYCLYGGKKFIDRCQLEEPFIPSTEMTLRLLFFWEKRKNNKFILLLWWAAVTMVDLSDCQLLVTVI